MYMIFIPVSPYAKHVVLCSCLPDRCPPRRDAMPIPLFPHPFHEVTPSGRILSRMISDIANVDQVYISVSPYLIIPSTLISTPQSLIANVDQNLIGFFDAACNFVFTLLALFILIIVIVPIVAVAVIVSIMMYGMAFTAADRTNR